MKTLKPLFLLTLLWTPAFFPMPGSDGVYEGMPYQDGDPVSHDAWTALLQKYVDHRGNVNYGGFRSDTVALQDYLQQLADNPPGRNRTKAQRLAYYINLYNASTVMLILRNYPVNSIREIRNPWGRKWIRAGGQTLSLDNIEHDILRKMDEPRIHFALNCASVSCPVLHPHAFSAPELEKQLESVTTAFIRDSSRNRISDRKLALSPVFKWYRADFNGKDGILEYIARYSDQRIAPDAGLEFLEYDWSLNGSE